MHRPTYLRPLMLCLLAGLCGSLPSCGSGGSKAPVEGADTSLMALASGDADGLIISNVEDDQRAPTTEELVNQAAMDLERILAKAPRSKKEPPKTEPAAPTTDGAPSVGLGALGADTPKPVEAVQDPFVLAQADEAWAKEAAARNPAPAPAPSTGALQGADATTVSTSAGKTEKDDRLVALAARLALMLRERTGNGAPVMSEAVALAAIEAFQSGALRSLDTQGSPLNMRLSAQDRETLTAARDRVAQSPTPSSEEIRQLLARIAAPAELKIAAAKLCKRVAGFGRYDAFTTSAFPAGRTSKAIVYTEIDGFGARPAHSGDPVAAGGDLADQVSVELEQSLTLFQDRDGYQVWHKPPQRVVETSRTKRHDFYLIQIIELNSSLAIGKYNLKVSLRDVTTGATSESIIPLEIVSP